MIALPAALGLLRSKLGLALVGALALSLALGVATWRVYAWGHRNATDAAEARAETARAARARVVAEAQLLDAKKAAHALAEEAAAQRARAEDLARRRRDVATVQGVCLDEAIPNDLLRALRPGGAGPGVGGLRD